MVDRSVVVRLRAEIADFKREMAAAATATEAVGKKAQGSAKQAETAMGQMVRSAHQHEQAWTQVGGALLGVGTAAAVGVGMAVSKFADFDESMSKVQAATHETTANMGLLRQAALDAGSDTKYSATQASGAIEELAKAGVKTKDVLGGGLTGALDLAAAGELDVADAAEIAATAMTIFGQSGSKVPHIADLLAAAAGKAQGSVGDMGMALKQAGLVADQTGLSIEETTGGLAAFASAGLIGSDSGTAFKSMLQRLTPTSEESAKAMRELGISAYDGQGQFIGLSRFAGNLQDALRKLTPEQRNAAMATIFGSDAVRAASVLYDEGAAGIQEWIDQVDDSGYAAETARIKTDNLRGDVERLGGAFDTALIQTGSASNGVLRGMTQALTSTIDAYAQADPAMQTATLVTGALTAAVALTAGGFLVLAPRIVATRAAVATLAADMPRLTASMGLLGKAAGVAGIAALASEMSRMSGAADVATVATNDLSDALLRASRHGGDVGSALGDIFEQGWDWSPFRKEIETTDDAIDAFGISAREAMGNDFWDRLDRNLDMGAEMGAFGKQVEQLDAAFAQMVASGDQEEAADLLERFTEAAREQGVPVDDLVKMFPEYAAALKASSGAQSDTADATTGATTAMAEQVDVLKDLIDAHSTQAGVVLSARDAQRGLEAAVDDAATAVQESIDAGVEHADMLNVDTEAGRKNQAALDDVAASGWDLIESLKENGATQDELQGTMQTTRDRFIATAVSMGMSEDAARELANELHLIPTEVSTTATVDAQTARDTVAEMQAKYDGLGQLRPTTTIDADTGPAHAAFDALIRRVGGTVIRTTIAGDTTVTSGTGNMIARAGGGLVWGPGTSTSDDVHLAASVGEYVIKADTVSKMPRSYWDNLNAGRFSMATQAGPAAAAPSAAQSAGDPIDYGRLARAMAAVRFDIDGAAVARNTSQRIARGLRA